MESVKKIIFSAYYCNPYLPSEASGAFRWLRILLKRHHVLLITSRESEEGVRRFYENELPENLQLVILRDDHFLKDKVKAQVHFGYFTFNKALKRYIKEHREALNRYNLIIHKNPTSFRYPTSLFRLDVPLVIGPIGGGLQVPPHLKKYFKKEPFLNKLRKFDKYLLRLPSIRRAYDKASLLLITLDYLKDILPSKYSDKIRVFFDTGIEVGDVNRTKKTTGKPRVLYVGKLIRFKGAELALRAVTPFQNEIQFDIAGEGVERGFLEELSGQLGLEDTVNFHGNVPYEKVEEYYREADIFLYPSLTEASGNVLLEAMKNRLPIVSVDNGGPKYMCPDEGAVKVKIDHPENMVRELSAGIRDLIENPGKAAEMGEINYRHCRDHYSWDVLENKIMSLVEEQSK